MNALFNADTRRGGNYPPHAGFASDVFPEAQGLPTGVSVRYAPDPAKQWFVLRATYARVVKAYEYLTKDGAEAYLPQHYVQREVNGKMKRLLEPLLPNILFVYATSEKVEAYVKHTPALSYLSYYYNHFQADTQGKNPPLVVRYEEMMNFIRATSVDNEYIQLVNPEQCRYKSGDLVQFQRCCREGSASAWAAMCGGGDCRALLSGDGVCAEGMFKKTGDNRALVYSVNYNNPFILEPHANKKLQKPDSFAYGIVARFLYG